MADYLKRELVSHTRRVCSLYKRMYRDIRYWEDDFFESRFKQLELRREFDKYKDIKDIRKGKAILEEATERFTQKIHPVHALGQPWHSFSKEGIAYGRNVESPDWVMDNWHPLEKAQYPYFFAKREAMKEEYINLWKKKMLKPSDSEHLDTRHEERKSS